MSLFRRELRARAVDPAGRTWIYAPYDQLTDAIGPLAKLSARDAGLVLIESPAKAARRPYHKQKLALVLTNMRHFALEQAARGVAVRYRTSDDGYAAELLRIAHETGPLTMMEGAERELRIELAPLVASGAVRVVPHEGWLTSQEDFVAALGARAPYRMDVFYKYVRDRTGLLMDGGQPIGGKYSFDADNRKPWRGDPSAPTPPRFVPDGVTREVVDLVETRFAHHPGALDPEALPATADDAEAMLQWARRACLPSFGPFEDAMSTRSSGLFHTRLSPLLNLHRLLPRRVVTEIASDDAVPLASREGFVRQVLGWREFVRHVHVATDGFRALPDGAAPTNEHGANPSVLGASHPLPPAYWGTPSGLACLDHVVADVWREGWSHHITRLMVLSNIATLLELSPRELTDWFWIAYVDAYDWVVEPNVLAMGSYAVGALMTTKPYISGAAYIDRMSDYCASCAFDPKKSCPITRLYWAFLARHEARFVRNPRTAGPIASVRKRADHERAEDVRTVERVRAALAASEILTPESLVRSSRPAQAALSFNSK